MGNFLKSNKFLFLMFLLIGGSIGAYFMYELKWDFANYHYYVVYALFNDRLGYDILPAALQTFFNPLIDIPFYFLVENYNNYPRVVSFIQGMYFGVLLFVFYKILLLFFDSKTNQGKLSIVLSLLIASTGFAVFSQIGTTTNEIQISILILGALYLLIKELYVEPSNKKLIFFFAGLLLGSAMGLKLTAFIYCISTGLTLILFYRQMKNPSLKIAIFMLGGLIGFLVFNGWWMWILWDNFQNPFFPFANAFFQSEYLATVNFRDDGAIPQNLFDYFIYPFYWALPDNRFIVWIYFSDIRFALVYVMAFFYAIRMIFSKQKTLPILKFLIVYCLIGYILWLLVFSIFRYYIPLEMIFAIFIVKIFWSLLPKNIFAKAFYISVTNIIFYVLITTILYGDSWGVRSLDETDNKTKIILDKISESIKLEIPKKHKKEYTGKVISVEEINLPDNTLIMLYNCATSAFVPLLEKQSEGKVRAVLVKQNSFRYDSKDFFEGSKLYEIGNDIIKNHNGPKVALVRRDMMKIIDINPKNESLLQGMKCSDLKNNIINGMQICYDDELENKIFKQNKGANNE